MAGRFGAGRAAEPDMWLYACYAYYFLKYISVEMYFI